MKRLFLTLLLGILLIPLNAFHIVGGEIEFIYLSDGLYRINLIMYLDEVQEGNPNQFKTGPDGAVSISIFSNTDGREVSTHLLPFISIENVEYTNIECARDELITSRVFYSLDVNLNPSDYSEELGYYLVWERCCRNSIIKNIVLPNQTGMKYVLEIPPLMKNGEVFVNSSPILFKPLSDYACINQLYYIEFTGTDPDGDSLVYSLSTPLNSSGAVPLPTPQPKPHNNVLFKSGYSESNMIPGVVPLSISDNGLLTVTPSETGLYVFSVLVDEYRDGVQIGQARRDFQMLVVDGCLPPDPPVVDIDIPGNPGFNPETDVLTYTVVEAKCFDFIVANVTEGETITLRAEGVNFDEDLNEIFTLNRVPVGSGVSELQIEVCIPDCPPVSDGPFILDIIAGDNACPLPQLDTLRLTIQVQPPPNEFPVYSTSTTTVIEPEDNDPIYSQTITATDGDTDKMDMTMLVDGLEDPSVFGFGLEIINSSPGSIEGVFTWDTDCNLFDFESQQEFEVAIVIDDLDDCDDANPDTLFIQTKVILPPNTDPVVSTNAIIPNEVVLGTLLDFDVSVTDADGDEVSLTMISVDFNHESFDVDFTNSNGVSATTSSFTWDLACNAGLYSDGQQFEFLFIGDDDDKCKIKNFDTLRSVVTVRYPENRKPEFESIDRLQVLRVNENSQIEIEAFDTDGDEITLSLAEGIVQPASANLLFEPVTGTGRVSSILKWQPECSLFRFGQTQTLQDVIFQVVDNACPTQNIDTLKVTFQVIDDSERQKEFLPPNVFTPNGDNVNDTFRLNGNPIKEQNLPANNCDNEFEFIVINNRAGAQVFRSESRDFVWNGGQYPSGVYYYYIKYSNTDFKGYVHLMR
ncbi:MAG: gliding motility-associated C-terminal domain-containing protein [Cyclobacteriaceae bacterium]